MKALSVRQPWASLIAVGSKRIETRSWSTPFRGPLAIHAAKGLGQTVGDYVKLCSSEPFWSALKFREPLARGAVLATCELFDVLKIVERDEGYSCLDLLGAEQFDFPIDDERAFGDYTPGRYAWLLGNVRPFNRPIPAKGRLGLWEWDPAEVLV